MLWPDDVTDEMLIQATEKGHDVSDGEKIDGKDEMDKDEQNVVDDDAIFGKNFRTLCRFLEVSSIFSVLGNLCSFLANI